VGFWVALQLGLVFMLFLFFIWDAIVFIFILWFKRFFCVLFVFMLWNTNVVTNKLWVKSHCKGAQKCYHIVLFSKGVHVWTSTMVILEHIFPNILHNMVDYNTKNQSLNCFFSQFIVCDSKVYLWPKNVHQCTLKNENILKNDWNNL
jgi:hypothetical protein